MFNNKKSRIACLVIGCLGFYAHANNTSMVKDELVVTANKIEEKLLDVPQTITVLDAKTIEEKGIKTIKDVLREIPNVTYSARHGGSVDINIRGLNPSSFTNNNSMVIYIDGVTTSELLGFNISLANIERIEVLRGPQGTLYGKDAVGGVINIVTKKPTNQWQGQAIAEYGSRNYQYGQFNTSGSLIQDKLFLGVNAQGNYDNGWIKNNYPHQKRKANDKSNYRFNNYLFFKPIEQFDVKLNLSYIQDRSNWQDGYAKSGARKPSDFNRDEAKHVYYDIDQYAKNRTISQSLIANYYFDRAHLNSVTTHKLFKVNAIYDGDAGLEMPNSAGLYHFDVTRTDTWTQEFRLTSANSEGIRWVTGLYFDKEDRKQGPYGMQMAYYDKQGNFLDRISMNANSDTDSVTQAIFGQVMIPFASRFELTLGSRLQHIKKEIDLKSSTKSIDYDFSYNSFPAKQNKSWTSFLPKAALSYKISPELTTYISYGKGYMPGGFNYFPMQPLTDYSFKPQRTDNYEIGLKGNLNQLRFGATLFYIDIKDTHIQSTEGGGQIWITGNAKKSASKGVELDVAYNPIEELELSGSLGLVNAKYKDYQIEGGNYNGKRIEGTPCQTANIGIAYTHPQGIYSRLDINYRGKTYFKRSKGRSAVFDVDSYNGYTMANVKMGYRFSGWDIYGYVNNLTDKKYISDFIETDEYMSASFGEPRRFGLGVNYQF